MFTGFITSGKSLYLQRQSFFKIKPFNMNQTSTIIKALCLLLFPAALWGQSIGDYRTVGTGGNWNKGMMVPHGLPRHQARPHLQMAQLLF